MSPYSAGATSFCSAAQVCTPDSSFPFIAKLGVLVTPWGEAVLHEVAITQSADVVYMTHPSAYPVEIRRRPLCSSCPERLEE